MTVHLEPIGADQVLLVEHGVVGTEEVEVLELKNIDKEYGQDIYKFRSENF